MDTFSGQSEKQGASGQVGAVLRAARHRLGESLENAAETLRIRRTYLEAIEDGRYGDLPGVAYALGFVRAYADYLGLHTEEVVRRYKEESQSQSVTNSLDFPTPTNEGGLPAGIVVAFALVLACLAYGAWYWVSTSEKPVAELIPDIPERLASLIGGGKTGATDGEEGAEKATPEPTETAVPGKATPDNDGSAPETVTGQGTTEQLGNGLGPRELAQRNDPMATQVNGQTAKAPSTPKQGTTPPPSPETKGVETSTVAKPVEEATSKTEVTSEQVVASKPPPVAAPAPKAEVAPPPPPAATPKTVPEPAPDPALESDAGTAPPPPPAAEVEKALPVESFVGQIAPPAVMTQGQGARVILRATSDTWIQVHKGNDLVVRRLLRAGDIYGVPSTVGLTVNVTNAGALEVYVDGKRAPSLGPAGAVRNDISLSPNRLKFGRR